jgi:hypothetical protein
MKKIILFLLTIVTGDLFSQYENIQVSNPANSDPNEVCITINPANPSNLAAGANINYYYYSTTMVKFTPRGRGRWELCWTVLSTEE